MRLGPLMTIPMLVGSLSADTSSPMVTPTPSTLDNPFAAPPELQNWARKSSVQYISVKAKVQGILDATFRPVEENGLGLIYDNSHTRTVQEVWTDRRANCLGLTAFLVAACKSVGIEAKFAEPVNMNHWRREGNLIRLERHVVALMPIPPADDLVADFLPQLRQRKGVYVVDVLHEERIRAIFHSNRAVELLEEGNLAAAEASSRLAIDSDPTAAAAWNIQGVVQRALKQEVQAEQSYLKAHALDPKDGAPIGNLEQLMKETGQPERAAHFRQLSLDTRKKDPYFNAFLSEESYAEGRTPEALDLIRAAIKLAPYDSELHLAEARYQLDLGKVEDARKSLEKARRWALPRERSRYDTKLAMLENR